MRESVARAPKGPAWFVGVLLGEGDDSLGPATRYAAGHDAESIAMDLRELRMALVEARSATGLATMTLTDDILAPNISLIRSAHVLELRAGAD